MYFDIKTSILKKDAKKPDKMEFLVWAFSYTEVEEIIFEKAKLFGELWYIDSISQMRINGIIPNENGGSTYYKSKVLFNRDKPITEEYLIQSSTLIEAEKLVKDYLECDEVLGVMSTNIIEYYGRD